MQPEVTQTTERLDESTVSLQMTIRGFPELERCWQNFTATGQPLAELTHEQIETQRRAHSQPLFGAPVTSAVAIAATTAGLGALVMPAVRDIAEELPAPVKPVVEAGYLVNLSLLLFAGAVSIQRYVLEPFSRLMARDTASMLSARNFRREMVETPRFAAHDGQLQAHGVGLSWDNPEYQRGYRLNKGAVEEIKPESSEQIILNGLRSLIGQKDPSTRRHTPGRLTPSLRDGKRSVTAIVQEFGSEIALAKNGLLSPADAVRVFGDIAARHCNEGSTAQGEISSWMRRLATPQSWEAQGGIGVRIWKRDPW